MCESLDLRKVCCESRFDLCFTFSFDSKAQGLRQRTNSTNRGVSREDPVGASIFFFLRAALRTRVWQLRRLEEARLAVRPTDERGQPGSRRCARVWSVWELAAAVRRGEAGG